MTKMICQLCNKILESGEWPTDWLRTIVVPISKYPGATECAEHRMIALISHSSKVLLCILLSRMTKTAEEKVAEEQMGSGKRSELETKSSTFD